MTGKSASGNTEDGSLRLRDVIKGDISHMDEATRQKLLEINRRLADESPEELDRIISIIDAVLKK